MKTPKPVFRILMAGFVIALCTAVNVNAQTLEWAKRMGSGNDDRGQCIAVDASGNVYTTGWFIGTVDFNPGAGTYNLSSAGVSSLEDIFIQKLDAYGNLVWAKRMGGISRDYGYSVAVDSSRNVYTTGWFYGIADFDPGTGVFNLTSGGSDPDVFVQKLDASGNFLWAKRLEGVSVTTSRSYIDVDASGNVYITGDFNDTADFDPGPGTFNLIVTSADMFVCKLDASGNFLWAKGFGSPSYDFAYALTVDDSGNVYTTGNFGAPGDFDPGPGVFMLNQIGSVDAFILKLDSAGNFVWAKNMGGSIYDCYGNSIALDGAGAVFTTGGFEGTIDFDPGAGAFNLTAIGTHDIFIQKLDASGNFIWVKQMGGTDWEDANSIALDPSGNIYTTGIFSGVADFDPGPGTFNLSSPSTYSHIFISKLDSSGNFQWANRMVGFGIHEEYASSIAVDVSGNVYTTGSFEDMVDFDIGPGTFYLTSIGRRDIFVHKIKQKVVAGYVFNDINQDCYMDGNEIGLNKRTVIITPGDIVVQTNASGFWVVDSLPIGTYTLIADTSGKWQSTCPLTQTFSVSGLITHAPDFGFISTEPCASPDVSMYALRLRRCFSNNEIYVQACNLPIATGALNSGYVHLIFDSLLVPQSASLPYSNLGNNTYRFNVGTLNPGQCVNFQVVCSVSCDAMLGQTLCQEANLYPADSCVFDTTAKPFPTGVSPCVGPWDKSSLTVTTSCVNDTIHFVVKNLSSAGSMFCHAPVRIYIDGQLVQFDSVQLASGDSIVYLFPGDGRTWRMEVDQHPRHPGLSAPNATIEACGNLANWTTGLVTILPQDDADPVVDIFCGVVTGSYDPNDKTGYPLGVTNDQFVSPNQQLQYVINFQNTGTDTAFTVIIRDTLDENLNIFSVTPGVSSHDYNFRMYGPLVLEWTFYNIQLPDSNSNEAESHGFVTFSVEQKPDLPNWTQIHNSASIYFDFNSPIFTNQTLHTVNDQLKTLVPVGLVEQETESPVKIFPNPFNSSVTITIHPNLLGSEYSMMDVTGKIVKKGKLMKESTLLPLEKLATGIYFLRIQSWETRGFKIVKN